MLKDEFFSQVFLCPQGTYSESAALIVCDTSKGPNCLGDDDEGKHLFRLYFDVYLGAVDDADSPTEFVFTSDGNYNDNLKVAVPLVAGTLPDKVEAILSYGRNWDGCQHISFLSTYEHICEADDWKMLCSALHALPDISEELLGPAWIDYKSPTQSIKVYRGSQ